MKTKILRIFAIVLCRADTLNLRGQPSLLQSRPPLPQNSSKEYDDTLKTLHDMESSLMRLRLPLPQNPSKKHDDTLKTLNDMESTLMRMAKSGNVGTPLKDFADIIRPHLHSMEAAVNQSHLTDQTTMDNLGSAFTACTTEKNTADGEASSLSTSKTEKSTAHKTCRTAEGIAETNHQSCVTAMNSLENAKTTACDAYTLANKAPNINLVPSPGQGASYRSWLVSVRDWVLNELANLDAANASCVNSTAMYDAKKLECEGAYGNGGLQQVYNSLKTLCNANQTALESITCSYADKVETTCSEYTTCWTNANTSYYAGHGNLISAQDNRVTEYGLVKRLLCFTNLFASANGGDLSTDDIIACKSANHSTIHLELTLPTVPITPGICPVVDYKPCSLSYTTAEYGSLPINAPAAACQACAGASTATTATTTTTTTATTTAVDCTTKTDIAGTGTCAAFTNFGVNGKSTAMWNYCIYPTQAIADAASDQLSNVVRDHNWMILNCEKTCCENPNLP